MKFRTPAIVAEIRTRKSHRLFLRLVPGLVCMLACSAFAESWNGSSPTGTLVPNAANLNVGVGSTGTPAARLQVVGGDVLIDNNKSYRAKNKAGSATTLVSLTSTDTLNIGSTNVHSMFFNVGGTVRMALNKAGWLGVGTNGPLGVFDVRGGVATAGDGAPIVLSAQQGFDNSAGGNVVVNSGPNGSGGTNGSILFGTGGVVAANGSFTSGERMRIAADGKIGIGNQNPSNVLHIRRDEGTANTELGWISVDRNGANNNTDPAFGIGYRGNGVGGVSRVWLGSGNNFPLDFRTSSTPQAMTILDNGNVGINNANPGAMVSILCTGSKNYPLHIDAGIRRAAIKFSGGPSVPFLTMQDKFNTPTSDGNPANLSYQTADWDNSNGFGLVTGSNVASPMVWMYDFGGRNAFTVAKKGFVGSGDDATNLAASLQPLFQVRVDGSVGIGTVRPEAKLHVVGDAKVTGNVDAGSITTRNWSVTPDYVFEKGYKLPSLDHVENFVAEHKHLPEVPSAKELAKTGMNLAEMNVTLLKKVEELTLYAIAQEKKVQAQEKFNRALETRIEKLELGRHR